MSSHGSATGLRLILRQRLPFLPLLLWATAGIVLSEIISIPAWLLGTGIVAGLTVFVAGRDRVDRVAFALLLVCAFALLHRWQDQDSPARRYSQSLPPEGQLADITGLVRTEPRVFSETACSFELLVDSKPITILAQWKGLPPAYGDVVQIRGLLKAIAVPRNPGQFNFAAWSGRRGIFDIIVPSHEADCRTVERNQGNPLVAFALQTKDWMRRNLSAGINDPVASDLVLAMVLGDTTSLPPTVKEEFRGTGTFHLFSVSGLHVGIVALLLWQLAKPLRIPRRVAAAMIIPLLFFYALMTGLQPASVRSAIMASIVLVGFMANRPPVIFNSVCAAAFVILLLDTNQLFNPGFQLSFIVVGAIIILNGPIVRFLDGLFAPDPFFPRKLLTPVQRIGLNWWGKLASMSAISLAAWAGSFPLILFYFHLVSLSALPANLVAVPISFAIMAISSLSLGAGLVGTWLSEVFNQVNWLLASILLGAMHLLAAIPFSYFYVPTPKLGAPQAEVVIFDYGSGGGVWLEAQGRHWLIDSGPARAHETTLIPFLRSRGLSALDGMVLTHGDAGHVGAAAALMTGCPPRLVVESASDDRSPTRGALHRWLKENNHPKSIHRAGDILRISPNARLTILYPPSGIGATAADDKAMVARLDLDGTRMLFLSDSGLLTEEWLLEHAREELRSDIVVKGAHRNASSDGLRLIQAASPRVVIATGADFPATERISERWVQALVDTGITVLRQDDCGAVTLQFFPDYWTISGFLNLQSQRYPK